MVKMEWVVEKTKEYYRMVKDIVYSSCVRALFVRGHTIDDRYFRPPQGRFERYNFRDKRPKMQFTDQSSKKAFCQRLASFIHVVDYMLANALCTLKANSLNDLERNFREHLYFLPAEEDLTDLEIFEGLEVERDEGYPQSPLINVELTIPRGHLSVDPKLEIMLHIVNQILDQWDEYICELDPFLPAEKFKPFTEPVIHGKRQEPYIPEGTVSVRSLIANSEELEDIRETIICYLELNYAALKVYIQRFNPLKKAFVKNAGTNPASIRNCTNLETFRAMLEEYHDQKEKLEQFLENQHFGLFNILFPKFRDTVLPTSERLIHVISDTLPRIGRRNIKRLVEQGQKAKKFLDMKPSTTEDYVVYLKFLEGAQDLTDAMEKDLDYCKELYDMMDEFEVPVSPEEVQTYHGFAITLTSLRNEVDKQLSEKDKMIAQLTSKLNKDIGRLLVKIGDVRDEVSEPWLINRLSDTVKVYKSLHKMDDQLRRYRKKAEEYKSHQRLFKLEVSRFELLDDVTEAVTLRLLLWDSLDNWSQLVEEWMNAPFSSLDPEKLQMTVAQYMKYINQLEKGLPPNDIVPILREKVEHMKEKLPVVANLRNPALKARHWLQIEHILNHKFEPDAKLTIKILEEIGAFDHAEELQEISGQASSETSLESLLRKVENIWKITEFSVITHRDTKDVFILAAIDDVQSALDESMININTIVSSRHVGPIKPKVDEWVRLLDIFSRTLDAWLACQQSWLYLESIFSAPDIQRQLPNEAKMFIQVDKSFKDVMRKTAKNPLALQACTAPGLFELFTSNNELLDEIMKCLEAYLESKRVIFPRFYFLSNDELLEILAQTKNPHAVQQHLRKCFDAIAKLEFGRENEAEGGAEKKEKVEGEEADEASKIVVLTFDIKAMISPEGEKVPLTRGLKARGNVEDWLGRVEDAMFISLKKLMKLALSEYEEKDRQTWAGDHPSQIVLTVSQIHWAARIHELLKDSNGPGALKSFESECYGELRSLAAMVRGDVTKLLRGVICSLITISVHATDIVTSLNECEVEDSENFEWLKQLRYYWEEDIDDCLARMSNACHQYGYEYLGASPRLVITPLTDRCYLCLMGALQLDLGGAPAGPAGTGKTETTKDLAKALAIQCVVFNCSEGLDFKMMGRFFSGLAQSGAWCCFDEFNRIDIEVLSVIAQQLITIRNAKAAKLERFMFEGREIKLVQQCAAFITMNPGYAGRTELPDNLKALFRPISMMVPDYALIAEVILYSEGFESSKILARKMTQMYKLCSEQLSQQDHYDFGMRAVKSVLVMAGSLKRENPDKKEDIVLIRALRDSNLPKFLADDADLFQGILNDLFPGVLIPEHDYGVLRDAIESSMINAKLQPEECMIKKVIQFHETMIVRHGVMLVGPTGGGKTKVLRMLADALTLLAENKVPGPYYKPVETYTLNPKSITLGELYGEVNPYTLEWKDGLLGMIVRTAVKFPKEHHQYVICDGPVDAVWIENMNTVLDDNKMLCLANSERIKLTPWVHMVFEVQDLAQASPATVSRCGMVYIDPAEMRWLPYVKTWLSGVNIETLNDYKSYVLRLFTDTVDKAFEYLRKSCEAAISQVEIAKAAMLCNLMESILSYPDCFKTLGGEVQLKSFISQTYVFCLLWALGANLVDESQANFENFVRDLFQEHPDARVSTSGSMWNVYMDAERQRLDAWNKIIPNFKYKSEIPFFDTLVPTVDTVRFGFVMEKLLEVKMPVLFTGLTGVGKSVIVKDVLNNLTKSGKYFALAQSFSAQTSSFHAQQILESKLDKRKRTLLGPPQGKKLIFFVDDVNMPRLDTYGSQPPIELLRQYLDFGGLYDREKLFWKDIEDVIMSAACAPPGGGRNPLTPRFVRHFAMMFIPSPTTETLQTIFKKIMGGFLEDFSAALRDLGDPIVYAAVDVYNSISFDLLPTPDKSHYVFNLRDLSKCVQGVLQVNPETIREPKELFRLFYHECLRVFHDRLTTVQDKSYFYRLMKNSCMTSFNTPVLDIPDDELITNPPVLLFGDFMKPAQRQYEEIQDLDKLKAVLLDNLLDYNLTSTQEMKLIFFMDAIEHTLRIARILRAERGNALLVGVGGMGKQSLTKLGSHLCGYKCFQIELTRGYDHTSFLEDLRLLYNQVGVKNLDMSFLITDNQIIMEDFLEDLNNMLNSGEVPNLFEGEDYENVILGLRPQVKSVGISDTDREGIFAYFISRIRSKLHVVVCMSPIGSAFRNRCRMFPSLVNCCTIDWFENWPSEALLSVAQTSLKDIPDSQYVNDLAEICVDVHESVGKMTKRFCLEMRRYYYTTPSSYLELINLYLMMLNNYTNLIKKKQERISNGLKKLLETNALIDNMKLDLKAMEPLLQEKSDATEKLMLNLSRQQEQADRVRVNVVADEKTVKVKAQETQSLADDAQTDLDAAMPAMIAATKALASLNKSDINELKVFIKPPPLVQFVMEPVCLLLGAKTDWSSAKSVLADVNFLRKLQEYDKDNITDATVKKLKDYVDNADFMPDIVAVQSKVCRSICMWVRAVYSYACVYRVVEPKRIKLQAAEADLNQIMSLLREKQQQLAAVEKQIAELEAVFDASLAEKTRLESQIELTASRLYRAGKLTAALGDEQTRWEELIKTYAEEVVNVVGNILLASAYVAYVGAFTFDYRNELLNMWIKEVADRKIPHTSPYNIVTVILDPYEIREWNIQGLPQDAISTSNALIVSRSRRWPLMIDPQEQANRWIRNMEAKNNLRVVSPMNKNLLRILEGAIRTGLPVLLEGVDEYLDPSITPVLQKNIFMSAGRLLLRLGDSDIEYNTNFKFYVTTKLANPHYLPEVCIIVTLVNFTVSREGLEDQLLSDVVRIERPDLENQWNTLVTAINNDRNQMDSIEDKILKMLFASKGNILDDEELIETLNQSKITSAEIGVRLSQAEITQESINKAREIYRPVANRGCMLFFVIAQLPDIDPMYQYSLKYFSQVFNNVLQQSEKDKDVNRRLLICIKEITYAFYVNVSRGLFEKHKLVYSFMLCGEVMKRTNVIQNDEWTFLLRGPVGALEDLPPKPNYSTLTVQMWKTIYYLEQNFPKFKGLLTNYFKPTQLTVGSFKTVIDIEQAGTAPSTKWDEELNSFEKLMLLRAIQEEKIVFGVMEYVSGNLGPKFIESPQIDLNVLFADMSKLTPLIFILCPGSDPLGAFQRFVEEHDYAKRVHSISLGQGQGPIAEKMILQATTAGDWIFLQNCHLATSWMIPMENLLNRLMDKPDEVSKDFRLFLSSMPSANFPVSVLQNSVKVTNEPPRGLRANVSKAFFDMKPKFFEDNPLKNRWRIMIYGIVLFHGVIQERKKFGPLGWNISYEFNDSDLETALSVLEKFCEKGTIPWDGLEYITGEITYGGRVTDNWDLRCLKTVLKGYFSEKAVKPGHWKKVPEEYRCPESPTCSGYEAYRNFIDKFPTRDDPEIFGMHINANTVYESKETALVLDTILNVQPREGGETVGKSDEEIVNDMAALILTKFTTLIDEDKILPDLKKRDKAGRFQSLTIVLLHEIDRFNILIEIVMTSLENLQRAIKGFVVMSESLEKVYRAILNNRVPEMWHAAAYPSLKTLASWVEDLEIRIDFISTWLTHGSPQCFWLSGFFFPQGFLTGVLQTHARKYGLPVDQLIFDFSVSPTTIQQINVYKAHVACKDPRKKENEQLYGGIKQPKDGVYVHGLFIDAGRWDRSINKLVDPMPGDLYDTLPAVWMIPVDFNASTDTSIPKYESPLYKTSLRAGVLSTTGHSTNFVITFFLPCTKDGDFWILRGTALLTQITD